MRSDNQIENPALLRGPTQYAADGTDFSCRLQRTRRGSLATESEAGRSHSEETNERMILTWMLPN